jgi:hypothetical protein
VIQVLNDGSTLVIGTSGIWSLSNPSGSIDIPAGVSGLAPRETNTPPRETNTQPQTKPADVPPPKSLDYKKGDDVNDKGQSEDVANAVEETGGTLPTTTTAGLTYVPLVSGSGYRVSAVSTDASGAPTHFFVGNQNATFNSTGQLTAFGTTNIGAGSHADFNSDGVLAWGRWIGPVVVNGSAVTYASNQGYHYVVGIPTATMPTTGTATYNLIGASSPTYMTGAVGPGTLTSATIGIQFNGATTNVTSLNMVVTMPDRPYTLSGSSISNAGSLFTVSPSTTGCATLPCSSTVMGFFSGASAERIGIGYSIADGAQRVFGAAALSK